MYSTVILFFYGSSMAHGVGQVLGNPCRFLEFIFGADKFVSAQTMLAGFYGKPLGYSRTGGGRVDSIQKRQRADTKVSI
jgi:hypothetical protein